MAELKIRVGKTRARLPLVVVSGILDAHNFEELEQKLDELFDQGLFQVVIDISQLEYLSSAGAGVFIGAAGRAQANEGNIVVVSPRKNVKEIFDLLGICHIFPVVASEKEAESYFSPQTAR